MNNILQHPRSLLLILILLPLVISGCGKEQNTGPTLQDIPLYPNASSGESMQANMLGMMGGSLAQYSTTDSYDEVMAFYTESLAPHDPELMSHSSELGRQAALSISKDNGIVTVSVQEFTEENTVAITFMEVNH
jgi:hypothetical protein